MCGKEAFLLKAFLDTFVATKVSGPPAAKSGYTLYLKNKKILRSAQDDNDGG